MVQLGRRYIALVLILLVISTALTTVMWVMKKRNPIELLVLLAPDSVFAWVDETRTISIGVTAERDIDLLQFRFRCLLERTLPPWIKGDLPYSSSELLEICPSIRQRMEYFSGIGAEPFIVIRDVPVTNRENHRLLLVDFGRVYSTLFDSDHDNESLTTFAFLINGTNHVIRYFEGYSDLFTAKEYLLELVRVESGGEILDYFGPSIEKDLPPYGDISFPDARKGGVNGVTLVVKKRKTDIPKDVYATRVATKSYLEVVETYVDGEWVEEASGYWLIIHGKTED